MFNLFSFGGAFSIITWSRFITATFSQPIASIHWIHVKGLFISWYNASWHWAMASEIGNFNGCLHYGIIKFEINLFNIMVRVSQALILPIISQCVFKINTAFHFLNIFFIFVSLFVVLKLTVTNTGLCFEFFQHYHKKSQFYIA